MYTPAATISVDNAHLVLQEGARAIAAGQLSFDLSGTRTVDSAAVAVLLEWQRCARQSGGVLALTNVPANLASLLALYGATELVNAAN